MGWQYRKKAASRSTSDNGSTTAVGVSADGAVDDSAIELAAAQSVNSAYGDEVAEADAEKQSELTQAALKKALSDLRDRAFRYLVRREHSAWELGDKLARFDDHDLRDYLLEKLTEEDAQSDRRFAENLGRVRTRTGKGPMVLQNELHKHRIDPLIIEEVMAVYEGQWAEMAEQVRVRKFGSPVPVDYKEWARQARFLQQRGFSAEHIRRADD